MDTTKIIRVHVHQLSGDIEDIFFYQPDVAYLFHLSLQDLISKQFTARNCIAITTREMSRYHPPRHQVIGEDKMSFTVDGQFERDVDYYRVKQSPSYKSDAQERFNKYYPHIYYYDYQRPDVRSEIFSRYTLYMTLPVPHSSLGDPNVPSIDGEWGPLF